MRRRIVALFLAAAVLCASEVSVLAQDDQIFGFEEDERVWDNSDPFVYESEISDMVADEAAEMDNGSEDLDSEEELEFDSDDNFEFEWETDYEINPIYSDVMRVDDLPVPDIEDDSLLFYADQAEYFTTDEEVIAVLREAMVQRSNHVDIYYRSAEPYTRSIVTGWTAGAKSHTGVSDEGDYLTLVYSGASWSVRSAVGKDGYYYLTIKIDLKYYTDAYQEAAVTQRIGEIIDSFGFTYETTDIQKFDAIYRWICENVIYDYDSTDNLKYTAYAALFNNSAVCQGYTALLYRMLLEAGVSSRAITGNVSGGGHAWNIVKIGEYYYNVDVTWDAPTVDNKTERLPYANYFKYMLKSDYTFSDHTRDTYYATDAFYAEYPMSWEDYRQRSDIEQYSISFVDPSGQLDTEIKPITKYEGLSSILPDAAGKARSYQITFDSAGGSEIQPFTYDCEFIGWNTQEDGMGVAYAAYDYFNSDQYQILYAQWEPAVLGELPVPEKANAVFEGWFTEAEGGRVISEGEEITQDLTCYAHWEELDSSEPVSGVTLDKTKITLVRTESTQLNAEVIAGEGQNKNVSWKSSNTSVTVDDDGYVTANIPGEATVTVTTQEGGFTAKCVVTVKPKDDIEAFVTRFYNIILDRRPDPTGLTYWTNLLRSQKKAGENVAYGFIFSNEFIRRQKSDADFVEYLYKSILGRSSDARGKAYWLNLMNNRGYTREKVFQGFIDSNEFGRLCDAYGIRRR